MIIESSNPEVEEGKEKIHSAQLKVYWKPKLSKVRSHGCFKSRVYDMIKPEINSMLDVKKINNKDAELDEGNNYSNFDYQTQNQNVDDMVCYTYLFLVYRLVFF